MNLDQARLNMVEQQIRPWDVMDSRVLDAIESTPRHRFVAESQQTLAYTDVALPIGEGQKMMEPRLEARVLQTLELQKSETVLEIGTGSGYVTALLCKLGASVRSIDTHESLTEQAKDRLIAEKIGNYILESGDALSPQWNPGSQYDVVVMGGAVREIPDAIQNLVKNGGRLLAIVEQDGVKSATLMSRMDEESWVTESLFETEVDSLIASSSSQFTF
ncbi:MAG: protein-L-isoaspartate O-methyltransferase [Gammaproteobacteria bacterium]|jgi:protein-L-isoaspartate(D-aspartate) O-methyltransferase|nr:protein-L-isoaspartate O-methyltransferase [Gammaproteobacteria bacterium]MBT3968117.1 protein-L-isoaspartate O-methyltransferase [Gammaproteobacteria bacterium]MBT5361279.1 protein-L-isoaspartate O-methyltransferase [Gammaproteobacteria bacterium]MBT6669061.1 protein-L-isoaspartate O-methyltransferase [Gammaproteobacteria bacterium]MBT7022777.1 protein-L-isoaspartate O-methyltransferase [Gammaproteobacteria bacterium]